MRQRDKEEIEIKLAVIRSNAEELHAMLFEENPATAEKFHKIGAYCGKLATCLRVHGQLPEEPPPPPIISIAKGIHQLQKRLPKKV